jgi:hypothetical protein
MAKGGQTREGQFIEVGRGSHGFSLVLGCSGRRGG